MSRTIADRVSAMGSWDPLIDDHGNLRLTIDVLPGLIEVVLVYRQLCMVNRLVRQRLVGGRPIQSQCLELFGDVELLPEIDGDTWAGCPRWFEDGLHESHQRTGKVLGLQALKSVELTANDRLLQVAVRKNPIHQRRNVSGILC